MNRYCIKNLQTGEHLFHAVAQHGGGFRPVWGEEPQWFDYDEAGRLLSELRRTGLDLQIECHQFCEECEV